ncbi:DUF6192 family protein [Saccharopolyspora rosea]|uniref:DUF6192 family protein n=1 Tax=Saccharopolyspora rosea TaxID=524884 RepID=A0ABW3FKR7_9PSEU
MIGHVTESRYERLVEEGRDLVEMQTGCQFRLGEIALTIEPMRPQGGQHVLPDEMTVEETLQSYADDIGIPVATIMSYRSVAAAWPKKHRRRRIASFYVHKIMANHPDRFEIIKHPPSERHWTCDEAARAVGRKVKNPRTPQEHVERVHDLVQDDVTASTVATDLLRRPEVAFRAMTDPTARHMVNTAQVDRARQSERAARDRTPAIRKVEHSADYIELLGCCATFVSATGRIYPGLRRAEFSDAEKDAVRENLDRVRDAADLCQEAVDSEAADVDEQFARLLRGEE